MTLLDKAGQIQVDSWLYLDLEEALIDTPHAVVPIARVAEYAASFGRQPSGLKVPGDCVLQTLQPWLVTARLIVVDFPKSRDGRGFTLANLLRERYGFKGDLRAAGPLLPDQFGMLRQCGFTSVLTTVDVPSERWEQAAASGCVAPPPRTLLEHLSRRIER